MHNVDKLAVKWAFTTHGDVSATPTVANGVVYFPDFGGYINAVERRHGAPHLAAVRSPTYLGIPGAVSRNSPAVDGNEIILGDNFAGAQAHGAHVLRGERVETGALIWSTQVDSPSGGAGDRQPGRRGQEGRSSASPRTRSPTRSPASYPCCSFRGSVVALNAETGRDPLEDLHGAAEQRRRCASPRTRRPGAATAAARSGTPRPSTRARARCSSAPGTTTRRPTPRSTCKDERRRRPTPRTPSCTAANDYFDSVLALSLSDGHVIWGHKIEGWDAWNVACAFEPPGATWCPSIQSPDYDFGGAGAEPAHASGTSTKTSQTLVGVGQKSGVYWAFNEADGQRSSGTRSSAPAARSAGSSGAPRTTATRSTSPNANAFGIPQTLPGGGTATGGTWAALDPATGSDQLAGARRPTTGRRLGPASVANGVVYVGDMNPSGQQHVRARRLERQRPLELRRRRLGQRRPGRRAPNAVYWGSGYAHLGIPPWTGNNKFYAFCINGN